MGTEWKRCSIWTDPVMPAWAATTRELTIQGGLPVAVVKELRQAVVDGQAKVPVANVNQALEEGTRGGDPDEGNDKLHIPDAGGLAFGRSPRPLAVGGHALPRRDLLR